MAAAMAQHPPRVTVTRHSGADFEGGRVGHRNGQQLPGLEHNVTDGTWPEEEPQQHRGAPGTGLAQPSTAPGRVRKPAQTLPARMGKVWSTVNIDTSQTFPQPSTL